MKIQKTTLEIFDDWAQDYHAEGMERDHKESVLNAFQSVPASTSNYLEVGVGNGYAISHIARNQYKYGRCFGLDLSSKMVNRTRKKCSGLSNVTFEAGDFLNWKPEKDMFFSMIFSMEVFYYFPNIQDGLDKAFQLLESQGMLMVLVNFYKENSISHSWPKDLNTPMQMWSIEEYEKGFLDAGFTNVKQDHFIQNKTDNQKGMKQGTLATWGIRPD